MIKDEDHESLRMKIMMEMMVTCSTAAAVEVARVLRGAQAMFTDIEAL